MQHTILIIIMLIMAIILFIPLGYLIKNGHDVYLLTMYIAMYLIYLSGVMIAVYDRPLKQG